mmetsp:Transcript_3966/g.14993  ORF Transcript_3966/g.14993 Transcript_3966/m.14993 type:complete len:277 (-) Transcript_3966:245-1075(-)
MTSFDESFLSKYRRGTSGYHPSQDTDFTNLSGSPLSNRKTPHKSVDQNLDFKLSQLKVNYQKSKREKQTFVIGVCGGSASGKTTVCRKIIETLDNKKVVVLSQDSFYKSLTEEQKEQANRAEYDFDHPDAFDHKLFAKTLRKLQSGRAVQVPIYDFKTHSRLEECDTILAADIIIVEGILIFYTKDMIDLMHMKIFVDTDDDTRLVRRIRRDLVDRGRDINSVLDQWERFVKPNFDNYIMPTKKHADVIIPRGGANSVAIDMIVQILRLKINELSI